MPPKVIAKNNDRPSGVLPVNAATRAAAAKGSAPRLKLEIRRLPPGLTLSEFEETLGDEWKLGNGKIDWREYRQGKVKQSAGKIPEQSRCYIHLANETLVQDFDAHFLSVTFHDKAGTHAYADLKYLPPTLGFAPNQRTPLSSKRRADNRQGTIDQDPEFIAFLEAETQPLVKASALDSVGAEKEAVTKVEIKSTPLIEALRERKANKAKAADAKAKEKDVKGHTRAESKDAVPPKKESKEDKSKQEQKIEQVSKEAVKALNKQAANKQQQQQQPSATPPQTLTKNTLAVKPKRGVQSPKPPNATPTQPIGDVSKSAPGTAVQSPTAARPPRQRGSTDGIKKMLQKDLGIKPRPTPVAQPPQPSAIASSGSPAPLIPNPRGQTPPALSAPTIPSTTSTRMPSAAAAAASRQSASPSPALHKAYLKHANPSQGMTEILIQQALSQHGDVANVTIDPRKGTAIAIFKDAEGLKQAIAAKRVAVANGNVEVLEFKDRGPGGGTIRGGFRGGGRGGLVRGGGRVVTGGHPSTTSALPPAAATSPAPPSAKP